MGGVMIRQIGLRPSKEQRDALWESWPAQERTSRRTFNGGILCLVCGAEFPGQPFAENGGYCPVCDRNHARERFHRQAAAIYERQGEEAA